jgi:hypothetical protein
MPDEDEKDASISFRAKILKALGTKIGSLANYDNR